MPAERVYPHDSVKGGTLDVAIILAWIEALYG